MAVGSKGYAGGKLPCRDKDHKTRSWLAFGTLRKIFVYGVLMKSIREISKYPRDQLRDDVWARACTTHIGFRV